MIHVIFRYLFFITILCSSCTGLQSIDSSPSTDSRHEQMSKELCDCSQEFLQIAERMQGYAKDGNKEALEKILPKMEAILPEYETCMEDLENKYEDIGKTKEDEKLALKALKKECPLLYQYMINNN